MSGKLIVKYPNPFAVEVIEVRANGVASVLRSYFQDSQTGKWDEFYQNSRLDTLDTLKAVCIEIKRLGVDLEKPVEFTVRKWG